MSECEWRDCTEAAVTRIYASYNADHGENVHPLHARYPAPMFRACVEHTVPFMQMDQTLAASTGQWLVVIPGAGTL